MLPGIAATVVALAMQALRLLWWRWMRRDRLKPLNPVAKLPGPEYPKPTPCTTPTPSPLALLVSQAIGIDTEPCTMSIYWIKV